MSQTIAVLKKKITGAGDLQSVVRTMKAVAAAGISQYERSLRSLADYHRTVELGLAACLREIPSLPAVFERQPETIDGLTGAVVFGSDQGLVGPFNDVVAEFTVKTLAALPNGSMVWAVGERVHARLTDAGLPVTGLYPVPDSIRDITPLIGQILVESQTRYSRGEIAELHLIYNRPVSGAVYGTVNQRLLPLDDAWLRKRTKDAGPSGIRPEIMGSPRTCLRAFIREQLFVSLFRACAESLASENASRLAGMQRADKNIDELMEVLNGTFRRVRQGGIDEELFDVISGFEALNGAES